jgi:hypothetical protein
MAFNKNQNQKLTIKSRKKNKKNKKSCLLIINRIF